MNEDLVLPYNEEVEKSFVSNCLQHEDCLDDAIEFRADRWIFGKGCLGILEACFELRNEGEPVDITTVGARLLKSGFAERFGIPFLSEVFIASATKAHQEHYGKLLRSDWTRREAIRVLEGGIEQAYSAECQSDDLVNSLESDILSIRESCETKDGSLMGAKDVLMETIDNIEKAQASGGGIAGISTGMPTFDKMMSGFQPGNMILIPARPSQGKTALLVTFLHDLIEINQPCAIFSLEMTAQEIMRRFISLHCNIPYIKLLEGGLTNTQIGEIMRYSGEMAAAKFIIDDTPALSINQLRSRCRRLARMGVGVVGIDYVQLMRSYSKRGKDNRQVEVSEISNSIKAILKECKMTGLVLCQLNRDVDKAAGSRKPRMSDIRESGALEQDADLIAAVHRPNKDSEDYENEPIEPCSLVIMKSRNGATGDIPMNFYKQSMRFRERTQM